MDGQARESLDWRGMGGKAGEGVERIGVGVARLSAHQAREYFTDPACGMVGDEPEDWMDFRALDGVCGAFHRHLWPGVWMGHLGALRDARGHTTEPAKAILQAYAAEVGAERIIGWVDHRNRPMLALAKRVGFEIDGVMPLASPVILLGWRP